MATTDNLTQPTDVPVEDFINQLDREVRQREAWELLPIYRAITGHEPVMWGSSIIGFGSYHYRYATGRTGTAAAAGFSPRSRALTVYLPEGCDRHACQLTRLGPHRTTVSCLYITRLDAVDHGVLTEILERSFDTVMKELHTSSARP